MKAEPSESVNNQTRCTNSSNRRDKWGSSAKFAAKERFPASFAKQQETTCVDAIEGSHLTALMNSNRPLSRVGHRHFTSDGITSDGITSALLFNQSIGESCRPSSRQQIACEGYCLSAAAAVAVADIFPGMKLTSKTLITGVYRKRFGPILWGEQICFLAAVFPFCYKKTLNRGEKAFD